MLYFGKRLHSEICERTWKEHFYWESKNCGRYGSENINFVGHSIVQLG